MPFLIVEIYLLILYLVILISFRYISSTLSIPKYKIQKKENIAYLNFAFVFLAFMVMFREEHIGNDTFAYYYGYLTYDSNTDSRYEPGYLFIYKICKFFFTTPYAIIFVTGGLSMLLFYIFIRSNSNWMFMSIMIFVFLGIFDANMNIVRQAIATGFTCYSYKYLKNNHLLKFLICIGIAVSFHATAIIFIIAWWFRKIKISKSIIFLALGVTILLYILFSILLSKVLILFTQYDGYQDSIFGQGNRIGALFQTSIYVILLINILLIYYLVGKKRFQNGNFDFLILMCIIGTIIQFLSFKMSIIGRIAMYFNVFQIILLPNLIMLVSPKNRIIISGSILFFLNAYYWTTILLRPEWNIIYPYRTFLF